MLKAAILDMDGTLLDSQWAWHGVAARYLRTLGIEPRPGLDEAVSTLSQGEGARYLIATYGLTQTPEQVDEGILRQMEDFYRNKVQLKPGAGEVLRFLREQGVTLCVVTATHRTLCQAALERCGVWPLLDFLLTADEYGRGKEEPGIFLHAMKRLGGTPEDTLIFEDAPHAISTAAGAGLSVVGLWDETVGDPAPLRRLCWDYWEGWPRDTAALERLCQMQPIGHAQRARALFYQGYNCSQSVAAAFAPELGLPEEQVLRMVSGFGAGFGRMREVCGTFSGLTFVISSLYGSADPKRKTEIYTIIQQLAEQFKAQSGGSLVCRELLGLDRAESSPVASQRTGEYYKKRPCPELVEMAAGLTERYLLNNEPLALSC